VLRKYCELQRYYYYCDIVISNGRSSSSSVVVAVAAVTVRGSAIFNYNGLVVWSVKIQN
jgi:hypothetical protein